MFRLVDVVPEDLREHTAFELLASSSLERYARVALAAGVDTRVRHAIAMGDVSTEELLGLAKHTWQHLVTQRVRDVSEVDLAILLAVLSNSADPSVDELLQRIGMLDRPPLSWISALARYISQQRPGSVTSRHVEAQGWLRPVVTIQPEFPAFSLQYPGSTSRIQVRQDDRAVDTRFLSAA